MPLRRALALAILLLSSPLPLPATMASASRDWPLVVPARADTLAGDFLLIDVAVNGKPFTCALDSGGSRVFRVDEAKALQAGLTPTGVGSSAGAGPTIEADKRVHGARLTLADGVALHDRTVVLSPLPPAAAWAGFDCVMGQALLRDYAIELDYVTPAVRLFSSDTYRPSPNARVVPFTLEHDNPHADVVLHFDAGDSLAVKMMLDTGASFYSAVLTNRTLAVHDVARRIGKTAIRPERSGDLRISAARPRRLTVAGFDIDQPIVALLETSSAGVAVDGLIGAGFFRRFHVAFNYMKQEMYLEPNKHIAEPHPFDASGVGFRRRDPATPYVVDIVLPKTPAARADLREGDELISIDGREARTLTQRELRALLSRPGRTCVLRVRRGADARRVTLVLDVRL